MVSFFTFMDLPVNSSERKYSGISAGSMEIMWFGIRSLVRSNQNADILVRMAPLSVILFFRI